MSHAEVGELLLLLACFVAPWAALAFGGAAYGVGMSVYALALHIGFGCWQHKRGKSPVLLGLGEILVVSSCVLGFLVSLVCLLLGWV